MKRKLLAVLLAMSMVSSMIPASVYAAEEEPIIEDAEVFYEGEEGPEEEADPVTVTVDFISQMTGGFLHAPAIDEEVSSDLAESYGYTDTIAVSDGVSVLDVLVRAHELALGEDFETEPEMYLTMNGTSPSKQFGVSENYGGFSLNNGYANDGTKYGENNYTGTTVGTQAVEDGDEVSFWFYEDSMWLDGVNGFYDEDGYARAFAATAGQDLTLTLKQTAFMNGSRFADAEAMYASTAMAAIEDVQIYLVDLVTGELTAITDAVTDEDGLVTLNFAEAGTYTITAYGTEDCEYKQIMSLTTIEVEAVTTPISIYGYSSIIASMELYAWTDGEKTGNNLLDGLTSSQNTYTTAVPAGEYVVEGYSSDGTSIGSIVIDVPSSDETVAFEVYSVSGIKAGNSGWQPDVDYTLDIRVEDQNKNARTVTFAEELDYSNVTTKRTLVLNGDTVVVTCTPIESVHPDYSEASTSRTITTNTSGVSVSCTRVVEVTFTVPEGSTVSLGTLSSYFIYKFYDAVGEPETVDGKSVVKFKAPASTSCFYRVQNPNGVTYWNYATWSAATSIEVSEADLYMDDTTFNKDTVITNYEKNVYDRADLYMNVNAAEYMNMEVGDTFELNIFRNWFAIESYMNSKVALPDAHYQVIDLEGNPSTLLTITPDVNNSCVADIKAEAEGTAIVLVTYDAMTHMAGMTTTKTGTHQYSALWPENTGVIVVSVGADGTSINTNMLMDRNNGNTGKMDAEHDYLFYLGDEGASYSFTPEEGCTVTVARSTVTDHMSFSGFTSEGVTVAADGEVTITGLTTGHHIVRVEKNGVAAYQVVTARKVSYDLVDADGNDLPENTVIKAGDTITLQFHNLVNPAEKLSGAYNYNAKLSYYGEDGTNFASNPGGAFGVYDFSGNPERQKISITIPKYWSEDTYTLNGFIQLGGFQATSPGGHRAISYATGKNPSYNAEGAGMVLSRLPELTISLAKTEFLEGTMNFADESGNVIDRENLELDIKDASGNSVFVAEDGTFKCIPETFTYVIKGSGVRYATGSFAITDENKVVTITLQSAAADTWDGTTTSAPSMDEDGVYQISEGSELAWISAQMASKALTSVKAVLTADIDLGDYIWTPLNKTGSSYPIQLDGQSHRISGLNNDKGLIHTLGGNDSWVKNLTVAGTVKGTGSMAGIVGYLQKGTIENCINEVNVSGSGSSIGGIAGYCYSNAYIIACINKGTIQTTGNQVGGIIGSAAYAGSEIRNCYNTASVTGTSKTGGIVGNLTKSKAENCFSIGTVTGGGVVAGSDSTAKNIVNCYYLNTAGTDEMAAAMTVEQLRGFEISDAFATACEYDHPALKWENKTTHDAAENPGVTAPTCTEKGYTTYTCTKCEKEYIGTYVDALGHVSGEDRVDTSVKSTYTCTVCQEAITEWVDIRLADIDYSEAAVSAISMADEGDYPWTVKDGVLSSSNVGVDSSTSKTTLTLTLQHKAVITMDYAVSSEARYDKMTVSLSGDASDTWINAISGSDSGALEKELAAGTYTIAFSYTKDNSSASGSDTASVKNIKIDILHTEATTAAVEAICTETGLTEGKHCSECNEVLVAQEVVAAKGHTEEVDEAVEATCTETGLTEGKHCSVCDAVLVAQEVAAAKGHTEEVDEAVEATCTETGLTEGKHCSVCNEVLAAQEVVDAKGHTEEVDEAVEATCTETGLTEGKHCSVCNEVLAAQEVVDALGHDYEDVVIEPTTETKGYTTHTCRRCGDSYVDTYTNRILLSAPSVKTAVNQATGIKVTWTKVEGAAQYRVYRKIGTGKWKKVADKKGTSFTDKKVKAGKTYSYSVRCLSTDGKLVTSGKCKVTKKVVRLNRPSIKAVKTSTGIKLTWKKVTGAKSYQVFRKTAGSAYKKIKTVTTRSFLDKKAKKGTKYTYSLKAVNDKSTSVYAKGVTIKR